MDPCGFRTPTAAVRLLNGIWLRYTAKDGLGQPSKDGPQILNGQ